MKTPVLALLALLVATSAPATSVRISNKAYIKETNKIVQQYESELQAYATKTHPGADAGAVTLYVKTAEWDIALVESRLHLLKKHKVNQSDVDAYVAQLSRDIENTPPEYEILYGADPLPKA